MVKKWEKLLEDLKAEEAKAVEAKMGDGFFKTNFLRKIKRKKKDVMDLKYSTLPSLPLRLRKPRSASTTSVEVKPQTFRVKSCSLSESSSVMNFDSSDSSWSAETSASAVDKVASNLEAKEQ